MLIAGFLSERKFFRCSCFSTHFFTFVLSKMTLLCFLLLIFTLNLKLLILHRDERLQRGRTTLEDLNLDCCKTGTVTLKFSRQKYSKAVGRNVWEWIREKSAIEIMANSCCWHQRWVLPSNAYVFSIFRMAHFQFEISDDEEEVCTKWSSPVVNNCRKSSNFVLDEVIFQACFTF